MELGYCPRPQSPLMWAAGPFVEWRSFPETQHLLELMGSGFTGEAAG